MSIIRLNVDEVFQTDSQEYHILYNAAKAIKDTEGAVVEIGTRRGGSAKIIIDALVENEDTRRNMFCIDPYGNIEYPCTNLNVTAFHPGVEVDGDPNSKDIVTKVRCDYTNVMRNRVIPSLYYYAYNAGLNFQFFCLEDTEFFKAFSCGVPCYNDYKTIENQYAFVFFDGPHTNEALKEEITFFNNRSTVGSVWVFDDIWMYDHDMIEKEYLEKFGFEVLEKEKIKASYKRVK